MTRALLAVAVLAAAGFFAADAPKPGWEVVHDADGLRVERSPGSPACYAVRAGGSCVLIDAAVSPDAAADAGVKPDAVLLTHHHRDTVRFAAEYVARKIPVRAAPASAEWLAPDKVAAFWTAAVPLRDSRTSYFVVPAGVAGIDHALKPGYELALGGWTLSVISTPGHARDHISFVLRKGTRTLVFAGDAVTGDGKLWTPFTTDWDHWTDAGLKPAAESIRTLANLNPAAVFPARGPVVRDAAKAKLEAAAKAVAEVAFLKSFERFTDRLGAAPEYDFLVPKEQIASGGDKPWARVSPHLWLTGNTYVLKSATGDGCLVLDPWGRRSVDQVAKLRADEKLRPPDVVVFSHAHYDHFDGVYTLPGKYQVWALDRVAEPLADPFRFRAPFLDERPIRFDRTYRDGETATWGGYTFRFVHLPGQTLFTAGLEATIDGQRCLFTADNFFHQRQFSGTGGWTGLNRALPAGYAASARKVLEIAPDRVLAEHGGPYVFHPEDYRRRVRWAEAAATAADAVSPSGDHRRDWNPHRLTVEPVRVAAKPGDAIRFTLALADGEPEQDVTLDGRGVFPSATVSLGGATRSKAVSIALPETLPVGRHVFAVDSAPIDSADAFAVVDILAR